MSFYGNTRKQLYFLIIGHLFPNKDFLQNCHFFKLKLLTVTICLQKNLCILIIMKVTFFLP